ncbi:peptide-methionine (R)-S-oxide reductase MsrB [Gracilimonas sp. BCB1]|uniref:peptide-methionine (R)-S-oxide reductase MsrB n=1 Tax=Gracilimonas sp. BCB1 TaxID=3152362 RepID=UPI0032D8F35B
MKYAVLITACTAIIATALLLVNAEESPATIHQHTGDQADIDMVATHQDTMPEEDYPFKKTEAEWKEILTSKEYRILRERGTELPYVNEYDDNKREGIYVCGGCGQKLYSSEHKYDSGTGWPSFWKPLADSLVGEREDNSLFMTRTEIVCSNCGGHLGHVFDDGPQPTGLRYCMNSAAMDFIPKNEDSTNQ